MAADFTVLLARLLGDEEELQEAPITSVEQLDESTIRLCYGGETILVRVSDPSRSARFMVHPGAMEVVKRG